MVDVEWHEHDTIEACISVISEEEWRTVLGDVVDVALEWEPENGSLTKGFFRAVEESFETVRRAFVSEVGRLAHALF